MSRDQILRCRADRVAVWLRFGYQSADQLGNRLSPLRHLNDARG
jgi:hypothetical protein